MSIHGRINLAVSDPSNRVRAVPRRGDTSRAYQFCEAFGPKCHEIDFCAIVWGLARFYDALVGSFLQTIGRAPASPVRIRRRFAATDISKAVLNMGRKQSATRKCVAC